MGNKFFNICKILFCGALLIFSSMQVDRVMAADATSVTVNGINIYDGVSYNVGHGISGVSYDIVTKKLSLDGVSISSVYANGDLLVDINGNNAIDAVGSIAFEVRGNLTITGSNGSTLNVMALSNDDRAIELAAGSMLIIGDALNLTNLITVSINRGRNINTVGSTTVVAGNTYNYTEPGGGGPGPIPGAPVKISINGVLVIDETADPQVLSATGDNWTISQNAFGGWDLMVDNRIDSSVGYISGEGDGMFSICPAWPELTVESDPLSDYSINFDGEMIIGTCAGFDSDTYEPPVGWDPLTDEMNINLEGGIFTKSVVNPDGKNLNIGSVSSPSPKGIEAFEVKVSPQATNDKIQIYTSGTALSYWNVAPGPEEGLRVIAENKGKILIYQANDATSNVSNILVQSGGEVNIVYAGSLGVFTPQAGHWEWTDLTGMNGVDRPPVVVTAVAGADLENKYTMLSDPNHFNLTSTSNSMARVGFFLVSDDSNGISPRIPAESQIQHGFIEITAAKGYRHMPGGVYWEDQAAGIDYEDYDYSIEVGSEVSIQMLPDYGYQFVSGSINGVPLSAEDARATYTFIMPAGGFDVSAVFARSSDIINDDSNSVSNISIQMPDNVINGNAEFSVHDTTDVDQIRFMAAAGVLQISSYMDLSLNEIINKGTESGSWVTPIDELSRPMSVSMKLGSNLQGYSNYTVLRDHNGVISEVNSEYDPNTGTLSFQTDAYSDYAIAHGARIANPNTYDGVYRYFMTAVASLLGICLLSIILFVNRRQKT